MLTSYTPLYPSLILGDGSRFYRKGERYPKRVSLVLKGEVFADLRRNVLPSVFANALVNVFSVVNLGDLGKEYF